MAEIAVAPFAGAWIETAEKVETAKFKESLPSRERGLKHVVAYATYTDEKVAPFAGAWIETTKDTTTTEQKRSLPSRERGLKLLMLALKHYRLMSLPSRERGLKHKSLE